MINLSKYALSRQPPTHRDRKITMEHPWIPWKCMAMGAYSFPNLVAEVAQRSQPAGWLRGRYADTTRRLRGFYAVAKPNNELTARAMKIRCFYYDSAAWATNYRCFCNDSATQVYQKHSFYSKFVTQDAQNLVFPYVFVKNSSTYVTKPHVFLWFCNLRRSALQCLQRIRSLGC